MRTAITDIRGTALALVLAMALHGLWPMVPMPASWGGVLSRRPAPGASQPAAGVRSRDTMPERGGRDGGSPPGRQGAPHPLACALCQLAHGAGSTPAAPACHVAPPRAERAEIRTAPPVPRLAGRMHTSLGARAPPLFPRI